MEKTKKIIFSILVATIIIAGCSFTKKIDKGLSDAKLRHHFEWVIRELKNNDSKHVLVAAHRGDWRNAPENSIRAIQNAIAMGADIVEIDVQKTKDGVLVLCHDNTIDRTMSGQGKVEEYTLAELQKMTLKSAHGCPTEHRIATFEACMMAAKNRVFINVDKADGKFKEVYEVLEKTGTLNQALVKSIFPYQKSLEINGDYFKHFLFMPVVELDKPEAANIIGDYFAKVNSIAAELVFKNDTATFVNNPSLIHNYNAKIWYNSLWAGLCAGHNDDQAVEQNKPGETWGWLIAHGANIIQTDRPRELLRYLKKERLHK